MASEYDDRDAVRERSGGGAACLVMGLLVLLLVIGGGVAGGFLFYQARRQAVRAEEDAMRAQMEARKRIERQRQEARRAEEQAMQEAERVRRERATGEILPEVSQPNPLMPPIRPRGAFPAECVRVVSGDTLVLRIDDREVPVRLIGVAAPVPGEPGHEQAVEALKKFCEKQPLHVAPDAEVDRRDAQGRALYWAWAGQRLVNLDLLRQGHGKLAEENGLGRYEKELRKAVK